MDDREVALQINQMVQFIHQEAKEKAAEIKLKTDEEFNIEKLRMVEAEKQKIRAEYERKEKQVEVQKRIEQSKEVRNSRLKALEARDQGMEILLAEAMKALPSSVVNTPKYPALLESLIVEALIQLADQNVEVKPVKDQTTMVKNALPKAIAKFKEWAVKAKGAEWAADIDVKLSSETLPANSLGGIEIVGFDGKISLANTLPQRLMLAYETQLPKLRAALFG
jgi:V-type H+-transporting ATPase subunit E